jgi:uncharacterized protein with FMN-binding domain
MKKKHVIILSILVVIIGIVITIIAIKSNIQKKLDNLADMAISNVDLSKIDDGVYTGSYKVFPVAAEVKVTVNDHMIKQIDLVKHENGQGTPAEIIPSKVVEAQSLEVDIVSGATYSSKVILKAIEDALINANK